MGKIKCRIGMLLSNSLWIFIALTGRRISGAKDLSWVNEGH